MTSLGLAAIIFAVASSDQKGHELAIGDPAPPLVVSKWIKGGPINQFEASKTYVVEFWATWCGPCLGCIPLLSEFQDRYKDRVTVIGVSVAEQDQGKVEPLVREMGDKMRYAVATDDVPAGDERGLEGRMMMGWLTAASETSIPKAFVVSAGKVAWIGRPDDLEAPLAKILAGQWDFAVAARERRQTKDGKRKLEETIWPKLETTLKDGWPTRDTLAVVDKALADDPSLEYGELGRAKFQFLLTSGQVEEASRYGHRLYDTIFNADARVLNHMAWLIVNATPEPARPDLDLALKAGERANAITQSKKWRMLDTLAQVYFAKGNLDKALATEEKAIQIAGEGAPAEYKERLEKYRKARRK